MVVPLGSDAVIGIVIGAIVLVVIVVIILVRNLIIYFYSNYS